MLALWCMAWCWRAPVPSLLWDAFCICCSFLVPFCCAHIRRILSLGFSRHQIKTIACHGEWGLLGGWLLLTPACTHAIGTSDPRKSRRRKVIVFLVLNVSRDTLIPFPGSKYRCRRISLGSHVLCSAHIVQISCFLNGVLQTSFSGPDLPVHHHAAAGDTPRNDSEGSGVFLSAQRHCRSCKTWKADGIPSPPSLSFCTAGSGVSGSCLFLWLE